MKKLIALLMAVLMVASLAACGAADEPAPTENNAAVADGDVAVTDAPAAPAADPYVIGICQLMPHVALDQATQGFQDALIEELGEDMLEFQVKDAAGEYTNCATIVDGFVAQNVDLILANATSPLQAAASATADIPILGTSVTDYATALNITDWTGTVGGNISGTTDLSPLDEQAAVVQELFPDAENVGLLYCSTEPNSVYQVTLVKGYLEEMGYTCGMYSFADVNELQAVTENACANSEVIYIPTDNTIANYPETVANVVIPAGVPVVAGESGICSGCGVATLSISYYDLGYATGKMAAQILTGEADISTMPVQTAANFTKMYNAANCAALNVEIPEGYEVIE